MNYFVLIAGGLYLGGMARELTNGNYNMAGVYFSYALANLFLVRAAG